MTAGVGYQPKGGDAVWLRSKGRCGSFAQVKLCVISTQLPPRKGAQPVRQFSAHIYCGQTARWIKMPLGREVGLVPCDIMLDGDPVPTPLKGTQPPIFGPYLLWPNGWIDQDPAPQRSTAPPHFRPISVMAKAAGCIKMPLGM